jgi:predicted nucleic acid-binding protein
MREKTIRIDPSKKILLDADVIIHFIKGERLGTLSSIFPNKLYLLDIVFEEVFKGKLRHQVENLFTFKQVNELSFSNEDEILIEYARLKKTYDPGESACMAYCMFHKDVLASSNLKDIKRYCEENGIQYLTTMDFLVAALEKGIMDEKECDLFIYNVKSRGSKLPCETIREFLK